MWFETETRRLLFGQQPFSRIWSFVVYDMHLHIFQHISVESSFQSKWLCRFFDFECFGMGIFKVPSNGERSKEYVMNSQAESDAN
jgi:hypothetical protein